MHIGRAMYGGPHPRVLRRGRRLYGAQPVYGGDVRSRQPQLQDGTKGLRRARRLYRLGVERVYGGGFCTYSDPQRFYSYRRDGTSGRMAAFVWLS